MECIATLRRSKAKYITQTVKKEKNWGENDVSSFTRQF